MQDLAVSPTTIKLNAALIRLAKGMISAWETWVKENQPPPTIEMDPDPIKHFQQKQ